MIALTCVSLFESRAIVRCELNVFGHIYDEDAMGEPRLAGLHQQRRDEDRVR